MIIIITYIYLALINTLSAHMIHINLNMILYTHVEHSPTKTVYIKYYTNKNALHTRTKSWHMADVMNTCATHSIFIDGIIDTD